MSVWGSRCGQLGSEILAAVEDARADWQHLRDRLVDGLRRTGHVSSQRVAAALRAVPRQRPAAKVMAQRAQRARNGPWTRLLTEMTVVPGLASETLRDMKDRRSSRYSLVHQLCLLHR
jgi:hypothetical protein